MVDLEGSSPQVDWGGNVVFNFTYAYVFMAMKSMFDPDIPNNDGCTAPIAMKAPLGSVVNCKFPAAVAARMQIGHFITEIIYRAMADVLPDRVIAGSGGTPANMNVLYGRHGDGRPWHSVRIRGGGMGASARADGNYVYIFPANGANTPVEILESDTPLIVEKRELLTDSGGIGRMKGGPGKTHGFENSRRRLRAASAGEPRRSVRTSSVSSRRSFRRWRWCQSRFSHQRRTRQPLRSQSAQARRPGHHRCRRRRGDTVNPWNGDIDRVEVDVREGYVSLEAAERDYGVIIAPQNGSCRSGGHRKDAGGHERGSEDIPLGLCSQVFINQTFIRDTHPVMQSDDLFH